MKARSVIVFLACCLSLPVFADVPSVIPVQGVLVDSAGVPVNDVFAVTFTLYSDGTKATQIWTEEVPTNFVSGHFTVYLGASTQLNAELFRDNPTAHLSVKVANDDEMDPFEIGTSPFASYAQYADHAGDIDDSAKLQLVADVATQLTNDGSVHTKYTDAEAVAAVSTAFSGDPTALAAALGTKDSTNPLNHDRYTDAEVIALTENYVPRFQDLVELYELSDALTQPGGNDSIWDDECLEGGGILHFPDVGNAIDLNWIIFTMKEPIAVSQYYAKTRTHGGANYFGNSKLWGSNDKSTWVELAYLSGDGVCRDMGPVFVKSNTRFKYFKTDFYGNGRTTYESLSHIKIAL